MVRRRMSPVFFRPELILPSGMPLKTQPYILLPQEDMMMLLRPSSIKDWRWTLEEQRAGQL